MDIIENNKRYDKQISLHELGVEGQFKLQKSHVLVIGAGGLGCPVLQYLAAAGVGNIGIVDYDNIDISNLHRQILYRATDIGKSKTAVAQREINAINPDVQVKSHHVQISTKNALFIIDQYDIIIDCTDNFSTRYLINDACVILNKPLIYGAVLRFEGQVGVFNFRGQKTTPSINYRDLFPNPPDSNSVVTCNDAGVIGVLPGIIGMMQATEAIKIICGFGEILFDGFVSYNILTNSFNKFVVSPCPDSKLVIPKTEEEFSTFDYALFCGLKQKNHDLSIEEFNALITGYNISVYDIREKRELPKITEFNHEQKPLSEFDHDELFIFHTEYVVFICQSGSRSSILANRMQNLFPGQKFYSLAGGITTWKNNNNS